MPPIRVLVVDDSVVIRKILCAALETDSAIEIAGTAPDGRIALAKITQVNPDLITLDIEMPGMNGLETLVEIRKAYPKLPVIMFSTLTERGAAATLDALSLGASDYATKPSGTGSKEGTARQIRTELIPKIKALCAERPAVVPQALRMERPTIPVRPAASSEQRIEIVAIGTSTGGPNALAEVLPAIPGNLSVPVVIVQHMPPLFTRLLAERLAKMAKLKVREGEAGKTLEAGCAWIAPGDYHMVVERTGLSVRLVMNQNQPENSCRPAVDVLFRSVARTYGASALGVVLTGMGSDGVIGSRYIREAGGQVLVQDEASSVVWGMPGQVVEAGQADGVYPLGAIGVEITRRVQQSAGTRGGGWRVESGPAVAGSIE